MRTLLALLMALPLMASAQTPPPPEVPPAAPVAQPPPPPPVYAAQPAQPAPPPAYAYRTGRDSWYIGFGLGTGSGRLKDSTGSYAFTDGLTDTTTVFVNFKVGATLTPKLLLGLDISGLRTAGKVDTGFGTIDAAIQVSNYDAMVTWFPMERGFFLRGGAGLSVMSVEASGFGGSASETINGVNLTVGGGYAFWIGQSFNLTLNLDFSGQSYNSSKAGAPSSSNYTAIWVGFDWY